MVIYREFNCAICKHPFIKAIQGKATHRVGGKAIHKIPIRPKHSKTCSPACSRVYTRNRWKDDRKT